VDPLPHQIEAVYHHILRQPHIRFLLADDPGAGKTIMAGLLLKELKARGLVRRALIVVPGHLKDQWLRELKGRFGETFTVVDRAVVGATWGRTIWQEQPRVITADSEGKPGPASPILPAGGQRSAASSLACWVHSSPCWASCSPWLSARVNVSGALLESLAELLPQIKEFGQFLGDLNGAAIALFALATGIYLAQSGMQGAIFGGIALIFLSLAMWLLLLVLLLLVALDVIMVVAVG